jgi:hypothetical protein
LRACSCCEAASRLASSPPTTSPRASPAEPLRESRSCGTISLRITCVGGATGASQDTRPGGSTVSWGGHAAPSPAGSPPFACSLGQRAPSRDSAEHAPGAQDGAAAG